MGLEVHLVLEVRQPSSNEWQGFSPAMLRINEGLRRDYDFLRAVELYPDKIESPHFTMQRGLPEDASFHSICNASGLVFKGGGISADPESEDVANLDDGLGTIVKGGLEFTYCTKGFCRNHTWLSYDDIYQALDRHGLTTATISDGYRKLLERADWLHKKGFDIRFVGWVCN